MTTTVANNPSGAAPPCPPTAQRSSLVERLNLGKILGSGSFAIVHQGTYDGQPVAVKVLRPHIGPRSTDKCLVKMFIREGQLLRRLNHDHIVRCLAVLELPRDFPGLGSGYTRPTWALVLELLEGGSLSSLMHKQLLVPWRFLYDNATALEWSTQIAAALAHLHQLNPPVIHRDVKLENIMLAPGQRGPSKVSAAKLVDLGLHACPSGTEHGLRQMLLRGPLHRTSHRSISEPPRVLSGRGASGPGPGAVPMQAASGPTVGVKNDCIPVTEAAAVAITNTARASGGPDAATGRATPKGSFDTPYQRPATAPGGLPFGSGGEGGDVDGLRGPYVMIPSTAAAAAAAATALCAPPPLFYTLGTTLVPVCIADATSVSAADAKGPQAASARFHGIFFRSLRSLRPSLDGALCPEYSVGGSHYCGHGPCTSTSNSRKSFGNRVVPSPTDNAGLFGSGEAAESGSESGSGAAGLDFPSPGGCARTALHMTRLLEVWEEENPSVAAGTAGAAGTAAVGAEAAACDAAPNHSGVARSCGGQDPGLVSTCVPKGGPTLVEGITREGSSCAGISAGIGEVAAASVASKVAAASGRLQNIDMASSTAECCTLVRSATANPTADVISGQGYGPSGRYSLFAHGCSVQTFSVATCLDTGLRNSTGDIDGGIYKRKDDANRLESPRISSNVGVSSAPVSAATIFGSVGGHTGSGGGGGGGGGAAAAAAGGCPFCGLDTGPQSRPATPRDVRLGKGAFLPRLSASLIESGVLVDTSFSAGMEAVYCMTGETGSCMTMAPEIKLKQPYNEKIDVYGFGIVLYEIWARSMLAVSYIGTRRPDLPYIVHCCKDWPELVATGFRPARLDAIPGPVWDLITECWNQDPLARPTMAEAESRLRRMAIEQTEQVVGLASGKGGRRLAGGHTPLASMERANCCCIIS
ncbi:hypothetical protein VaNZ11_014307 [Volvox africanus]|uniref:Protein kinase domain-containing protein n=1 Tax=Volvox africanus TaxID=51714 RepID=A0ABQ5SIW9_9CHLO|nr:hypothetical protein VaNZ11_014307 [Volvox africanus]